MYKQTTINNLLIVEIDNFISEKEADNLLNSKINSFNKAISHYPSYYRNNDRLVEDNVEISSKLFNRFKGLNLLKKEVLALNERIRFCRYQNNQSFSKHQDGIHYTKTLESKYTFLLYLNDNIKFTGGDTLFYTSKNDSLPTKRVVPKKGKLVVFNHKLWHKGDIVFNGSKYILRSDLMVLKNLSKTHHDGYIWNLLKLNNISFLSCGRDKTIKLWDIHLKLQNSFQLHSNSVIQMIRYNTTEFISCSRDFTIKKWNLSGTLLASIALDEMTLKIIKAKNNTILAVGTSGCLHVLNSKLQRIESVKIHTNWIWGIYLIDDATVLTCSEDKTINITNLKTKKTTCLYKHKTPLFSINVKNGTTIHVGTKEGELLCINIGRLKTCKIIKLHGDIIRTILYYNNSIITCGEDNKIMLTNLKTNITDIILTTNNFIEDIIVINNIVYAAGFNGEIMKINLS